VDAVNPWIDGDLWRACEVPVELWAPPDDGRPCAHALDLSSKRDLTAHARAWLADDGAVEAELHFWTPADTMLERERTDRAPYAAWTRLGVLDAVPGRSIDYAYVAKYIAELLGDGDALAFDPWRMEDFQRALDGTGVDSWLWEGPEEPAGEGLRLVRHGQGFGGGASASSLWMPRSVTFLEDLVLRSGLRVKKNPPLTWCSANAVMEADPAGNKKFSKRKSTGRIDGIVALCMAVGLLLAAPPANSGESIYDKRARENPDGAVLRTFG
jgi:phage terminase large subunit-like protein